MAIVSSKLQGGLTLVPGSIVDDDINDAAGIERTKLALDSLMAFTIPLTEFRVWDAVEQPLPGSGNVEAGVAAAGYAWDPNSADVSFFVANRRYRVVGIKARVEVTGTDGSAVTAVVRKAASGTDIAAGTALHSGTINLKGTVDTDQAITLSATSTDLDIEVGDAIGLDFTGTLTTARGAVTVLLAPRASADDLTFVGGTYGASTPALETPDVKNLGAQTFYARAQVQLPAEFVADNTVAFQVTAGMVTTVASASATVLVEAYRSDGFGGLGSQLVTTTAQSINSLVAAEKTFTIPDGSGLQPGDMLDVRVTVAINDSGTGTAVKVRIGSVEMLCDIQG